MVHIARHLIFFFILPLIFGCTEEGSSETTKTPSPPLVDQDRDGDGYTPEEGDCNDLDQDISPSRAEYCDGADNDCDDKIDEDGAQDAPLWYVDQDDDGYGNAAASFLACEPPSGFVSNQLDCDDLVAENHPGALEYCDAIDNDCDDLIDEGEPADINEFYLDQDGDGYGIADVTTMGCEVPDGYAEKDGDCDDTEANSYPNNREICDGIDNDCNGEIDGADANDVPDWYLDVDGDGYGQADSEISVCAPPADFVSQSGDCNEGDANINPGADEVCDAIDNNCDGEIDGVDSVDTQAFFVDNDGDGYGNPSTLEFACEAPEGFVAPNTDCNDDDPEISPAADELCNDEPGPNADNDCDGQIDEDSAIDAITHYTDEDGDGFGDESTPQNSCELPDNRQLEGGDCDDANPDTNPEADELCDDGDGLDVDNDCDGLIDEGGAIDAMDTWPDQDGDGYGEDGEKTPACALSNGWSATDGDCDDSLDTVNPDQDEICDDGLDNNCDGSPGDCTLRHRAPPTLAGADIKIIGTQAGGYLGEDVALVGDVNGDGLSDVLVGAWAYDVPEIGQDAGAAFLYYGPLTPRNAQDRILDREADVIFYGAGPGDHAGTAVHGAGDVNADGFADILIGSNLADLDKDYQGASYLFYGPLQRSSYNVSEADAIIYGDNALDFAGTFLSAGGDLNYDGVKDIIIGAPGYDQGNLSDVGAVYVVYGPVPRGVHKVGDIGVRLTGSLQGEGAGHGIAGGGDITGDGKTDLVVGAPFSHEGGEKAGKVYVVHGPLPEGSSFALENIANAIYLGEDLGQGNAGYVVGMAVDLTGDRIDDILIGAPNTDTGGFEDNGTAYMVKGPPVGRRALHSPPDVFFDGMQNQGQVGISLIGPGDLDLDGYGEMVVGSWRSNLAGNDAGAIALFFGPTSVSGVFSQANTVILGESPGDQAGVALDGGQDINGDGNVDLVIGALGRSEGASQGGAVYIIYGHGF